jgi:hypothetical protein
MVYQDIQEKFCLTGGEIFLEIQPTVLGFAGETDSPRCRSTSLFCLKPVIERASVAGSASFVKIVREGEFRALIGSTGLAVVEI